MALPPAAVGNSPRPIWNAKVGPSGRGERQPGMGTPESSMPSDAFRTGAHVTLAPVRIWHAETNDSEHRHEQSPVAVRMPPQPSRSHSLLTREPSAERSTKRQHPPRSALWRADSDRAGVCVIGDAACDGDEPGHGQALGQVCYAGRDGLGSTSSLEALKALSAGHRKI